MHTCFQPTRPAVCAGPLFSKQILASRFPRYDWTKGHAGNKTYELSIEKASVITCLANGTKVRRNTISHPLMNGCTRASLGVILLVGSRARHLSNRSINDTSNLFSSSLSLTEVGGINRARKSRVGLEICTFRTTS